MYMASSSSSPLSSSSAYSNSPCAACKFLRRKCMPDCMFAPYFPPEEPQKFANVHKIFGASNVSKLLHEVAPQQREDAVNSLAYEAEARMKDPVYGCVGAISVLQRQVIRLQKELDATNADLLRFANCTNSADATPPHLTNHNHTHRRNGSHNLGGTTSAANNNYHHHEHFAQSSAFYYGSSPSWNIDHDHHDQRSSEGGGSNM